MNPSPLREAFDSLASTHRVILFGGKGGVGKTTLASLAAVHLSNSRRVVLFTTDPASNLQDLFSNQANQPLSNLTIEQLDAGALYKRFLDENLASFLELGDRGTYLDREELRRFFELSLPGVDELMAWSRIGELAEQHADDVVIVDSAPTGHTLRMLDSGAHFQQLTEALESMQAKHRAIVKQLARRTIRDAIDEFLLRFSDEWQRRQALVRGSAFVPVFLAEPLVIEQTGRLVGEVHSHLIAVPIAILNRTSPRCGCDRCQKLAKADDEAMNAFPSLPVVKAERACVPLDGIDRLRQYLAAAHPILSVQSAPDESSATGSPALRLPSRLVFLAGKGGVGKTTCAASIALQLAGRNPAGRYVVISIDPAHSLPRLFERESPPPNLVVETIDTGAMWQRLRESVGEQISEAVDALTPKGFSLQFDREAAEKLIEIAPPGADELFAVKRLADLIAEPSFDGIIVDTAPTGHFLRLLDLPQTAGEWVREFMRILLRYRDVIPSRSLGAELVSASKALHSVSETLRSSQSSVVVVTRAERIVVAETQRLIDELQRRTMPMGGVIANYVTPASDCRCDASTREFEIDSLRLLDAGTVIIERRQRPPQALSELRSLVPIESAS